MLVPAVAFATSMSSHTLAQRAAESDRVVLVQVLSRETILENNDPRKMRTVSQLAIASSFKGEGPLHVTLVQLGGKSGLWESRIPGDAQLEVGSTALAFLKCGPGNFCSLVALGAGALRMVDGHVLVPDLKTQAYSRQSLASVVAQLQLPQAAK